jgi:hypothetical protein
MKIEGPRPTGGASAPRKAGGAASGFTIPASQAAPASPATGAPAPAALDGVLALQIYDPQRRRSQVRRGSRTLDALEAVARAHLEGETPLAARLMLTKLQSEIEPTGDPDLDAALRDIDVRAAVELAKLDVAEKAA